MSGLAKRIREAREAKGLTALDVERAMHIRSRYIKAIDAGDFAQLPDGPAGRGFVKNYARFVGLDSEEALSLFEAEYGIPLIHLQEDVPPPPERVPQQSEYTRVAPADLRWKGSMPDRTQSELDSLAVSEDMQMGVGVTVPEISRLDGTTGRAVVIRPTNDLRASKSSFRLKRKKSVQGLDTGYDTPKRMSGRPSMYRIDASIFGRDQKSLQYLGWGVAALAALGLVWFVLLPLVQTGASAVRDGVASVFSGSATATPFVARVTIVAPAGAAIAPLATATVTDPSATGVSDQPVETVVTVAPAPGGGLQLAVDARERAVIKVIIDGTLVFQGIPPLGPNPAWSASKSIIIETGNAGAFDVLINGERRGSPGKRNDKVRITYTL